MPHFKKIAVLVAIPLLGLLSFILYTVAFPADPALAKTFGELDWRVRDASTHSLGAHQVVLDPSSREIRVEKQGRRIWETIPGRSFLGASTGELRMREHRGSFSRTYHDVSPCDRQTVNAISTLNLDAELVQIQGQLRCGDRERNWEMLFRENEQGDLEVYIEADQALSRLYWRIRSTPQEHVFGSGEQFTFFDLKGHVVPIWVSEQGIGRGLQPLTWLMDWIAGSGGSAWTTYMSSGSILTSENRGFFRGGSRYGEFDFSNPDEIVFDYWDRSAQVTVTSAATPKSLLTKNSFYTGKMRPLPDWIHMGAILGLQGGTEKVRRVLGDFEALGTPISGVWIQDWVGQRRTSIGKQLWWNWRLDQSHYSDWDGFKSELSRKRIRLLGYVNPFLVDVPDDKSQGRHLLEEARERGYLVQDKNGEALSVSITSFDAHLVDLSNPQAWAWLQDVIKSEMLSQGFSGWMADFGEALPTDVRLKSQDDAREMHNLYPVQWAQLNREVVDEQPNARELVFFTRAGFSVNPHFSTLFWTGDQLVSWDEFDGIKTALTALLSSGLSGVSFNHSDIGGYTSFSLPLFSQLRSEELLMRWMELNVFSAVFRTHEGNQPENNVQVYSTPRLREAFDKNVKLFSRLFSYRLKLIREASESGWPVVRPMWLEFPEESETLTNHRQFMLGDEILVAPVLDPGMTSVRAFFPKGKWTHLITGEVLEIGSSEWRTVAAPLGQPAAYRRGVQ